MATVKKGNVELTVDACEVEKLLTKGYDEIDGKGKVLHSATAGKSVSIEEHNMVVAALEAKIAKLSKKNEANE